MTTETVYRSPSLNIFSRRALARTSGNLVVCFQYLLETPHLDHCGFCEQLMRDLSLDAVFVNCASNAWYQYPDLPRALETLRSFAAPWSGVITFGSSMGGYAALRFAPTLSAAASIAVGPQYSPRSRVVPGEHRYDAMLDGLRFLYEDRYRADGGTCNYVMYDPLLPIDREHADRYAADAPIVPVRVPLGGHTPSFMLAQCGLFPAFIADCVHARFEPLAFRQQVRKLRAKSSAYLQALRQRRGEAERRSSASTDAPAPPVVSAVALGQNRPLLDPQHPSMKARQRGVVGD